MENDYNKPENICVKCIHYKTGYCHIVDMKVSSLYVCPNYEKREK